MISFLSDNTIYTKGMALEYRIVCAEYNNLKFCAWMLVTVTVLVSVE